MSERRGRRRAREKESTSESKRTYPFCLLLFFCFVVGIIVTSSPSTPHPLWDFSLPFTEVGIVLVCLQRLRPLPERSPCTRRLPPTSIVLGHLLSLGDSKSQQECPMNTGSKHSSCVCTDRGSSPEIKRVFRVLATALKVIPPLDERVA